MALQEKDKAPEFQLMDQEGKLVKLSDFQGLWILIYFYPKDDTPGCTTEACSLSERLPDFSKVGLTVLGISPDSVASHRKFAQKYKLAFSLLADDKKEVVQLYGVWGLKKFMGNEFMGVLRSSFLIDPEGRIAKIYSKVKPEEHAAEVWNDYQQIISNKQR